MTTISAITLFVDDLAAARDWYARAFGLPEHYSDDVSVVFLFEGTMINLLQVSEAAELIGPASVGKAGAGAGARAQYTVTVADVDASVGTLRASGIDVLNGPLDRPWGVRTAAFADPAGHVWEFAAPIG
ncbi:VOC family protein [Pseudolysinimonas yzui]|uniref:Glyoxalase n=1 Tax=Pseudolysinimonas yzui TaxID=2708254 RepID=A0A8J3GN35_9MICO|nr:VOC family protein [Pseudolysinimonas yzui]GHF05768.1 glyoxalase [Pseudolysinimonas yzui]